MSIHSIFSTKAENEDLKCSREHRGVRKLCATAAVIGKDIEG